jgi:hypothetical protein
MYRVIGVNEYGEVYLSNGLLQPYKENISSSIKEFEDLNSAKDYALSLIKSYPQIHCEIWSENELLSVIQDDLYWDWQKKHCEEWKQLNIKGKRVAFFIENLGLTLIGVLLAVVAYITSDMSFWAKLIIFPIFTIVFFGFIPKLTGKIL